jgi:hypothetical protein
VVSNSNAYPLPTAVIVISSPRTAMSVPTMTLHEKIATFAAQHGALTHELDALEPALQELPSLENGYNLMTATVAAHEKRISEGSDRLKRDWRVRSSELQAKGKNDAQTQAKYQQEYKHVTPLIAYS